MEYSVWLSPRKLEYLKNNMPFTVTCNEEPNYDDVVSCFLMSKLLTFLDIKHDVRFFNPIKNKNTLRLLDKYPVELSNFVDKKPFENKLIIVNATVCTHGEKRVAVAVDNCFPNGKTPILSYVCRQRFSCAMVLLDLLKYYNCAINNQDILNTIVAVSNNTFGMKLKADSQKRYDYLWIKKQAKSIGADLSEINNDCLCFTDFSESISDITFSNTALFSFDRYSPIDKKVKTYTLNTMREIGPFEIASYSNFIRGDIFNTNIKCGILVVNDMSSNSTSVYFIYDKYSVSVNFGSLLMLKNEIIPLFNYVVCNKENINELFVKMLSKNNITVTTMESCTSGYLASLITDVEGASSVFKGGDITYSNQQKISRGVPNSIIDVFSVYSFETAKAMAQAAVQNVRGASLGIGVTGCARNLDPNNNSGVSGHVYIGYHFNSKDIATVKLDLSNDASIQSRRAFKEKVATTALMFIVAFLKYNFKELNYD